MQLQTVLCYPCIYDFTIITIFLKSNKTVYSIMVSSSQRNFPSAHLITVQINTVTELLDTYGDKVWRSKPGFKM